jgi:hypothetical protein
MLFMWLASSLVMTAILDMGGDFLFLGFQLVGLDFRTNPPLAARTAMTERTSVRKLVLKLFDHAAIAYIFLHVASTQDARKDKPNIPAIIHSLFIDAATAAAPIRS